MRNRAFFLVLIEVLFKSFSLAQSIRGTVIDSVSRQPIAFANVTLEDGRTGTSTDIEGTFNLTIPANYSGVIYLSHVSYQKRIVSLEYFKTHSVISLLSSSTLLQEVAVTTTKTKKHEIRNIPKAGAHKEIPGPR